MTGMTSSTASRRVGVLAPMRHELRPLMRPLALRRTGAGPDALYTGGVGRVEVVATITRMGTRAAAQAAERVLDSGKLDHMLVVGIAGGIGPSLKVGDLMVPERVLDLSTGAEHRPARLGAAAPRGTLATADGLIVDPVFFAGLEQRGVIAIDMETSAVAAVCEQRGCPWSVFRAISDRAGDPAIDAAVFGLATPDGGPDLAAIARFVLTRPWRLPRLAKLGRDMRVATQVAADAAVAGLSHL
jgi:adenosylhomocysteine nucleosidase